MWPNNVRRLGIPSQGTHGPELPVTHRLESLSLANKFRRALVLGSSPMCFGTRLKQLQENV